MRSIFIIDLQQGKVLELVHGDNADLFVIGAFQLPVLLMINFDRNLRLSFDHVEVRDEIAILIKDEARTETTRRSDLHDCFAQLIDQFTHRAFRERSSGRLKNIRRNFAGRHGRWRRRIVFARGGLILGNLQNLIARDNQHGKAEVNDQLILLFGQNFAGDGGFVS